MAGGTGNPVKIDSQDWAMISHSPSWPRQHGKVFEDGKSLKSSEFILWQVYTYMPAFEDKKDIFSIFIRIHLCCTNYIMKLVIMWVIQEGATFNSNNSL